MTAIQIKMQCVCLLALALGLLLIVIPAMNAHAEHRHGRTAFSARHYMSDFDPNDAGDDDEYFEGVQPDGRKVRILRLPKLQGHTTTWAIVVTVGGFMVTCFLSQSKRQVRKMKDKCRRME